MKIQITIEIQSTPNTTTTATKSESDGDKVISGYEITRKIDDLSSDLYDSRLWDTKDNLIIHLSMKDFRSFVNYNKIHITTIGPGKVKFPTAVGIVIVAADKELTDGEVTWKTEKP